MGDLSLWIEVLKAFSAMIVGSLIFTALIMFLRFMFYFFKRKILWNM